jgi:hypothetical protein
MTDVTTNAEKEYDMEAFQQRVEKINAIVDIEQTDHFEKLMLMVYVTAQTLERAQESYPEPKGILLFISLLIRLRAEG